MKTSTRDETQVGPDLQPTFQSLNDLIGEFGVESMEVADLFRLLARAIFVQPAKKLSRVLLNSICLPTGGVPRFARNSQHVHV